MTNHESTAEKPRFRWLDRWLEPRWRALLTWVTIAAITAWMVHLNGVVPWIFNSAAFVSAKASAYLPPAITPTSTTAAVATITVVSLWYQPLILRLGMTRWSIWILVSIGLSFISALSAEPLKGGWLSLDMLLYGIQGVVVIGRRSRPWMALVASVIASLGLGLAFQQLFWWESIAWNLIYGAIMLYGTDPLPRSNITDTSPMLPKPQ